MAFTIKPDGTILVETIDELKAVLAVRSEPAQAKPEAKRSNQSARVEASTPPSVDLFRERDLPSSYRAMYEEAVDSPQQQRLMLALAAHPGALTDEELRTALGLENNLALRGLLIGIVRRARNRNLPDPIVTHKTRVARSRRVYRYSASVELRKALEDLRPGEKLAV